MRPQSRERNRLLRGGHDYTLPNGGRTKVLVVANKTATTTELLDAVHQRSLEKPCSFALLVPNAAHGLHAFVDPEDQGTGEVERVINHALPLLEKAAGADMGYIIGDPLPMNAIQDAVNVYGFEEIILSTLPKHISKWIKMDLPSKLTVLGLPITTIITKNRDTASDRTPA